MRLWLLFDPRRALIGLFTFLIVLALLIHFILLGTERYNWIDKRKAVPATSAAMTYPGPSTPTDSETLPPTTGVAPAQGPAAPATTPPGPVTR